MASPTLAENPDPIERLLPTRVGDDARTALGPLAEGRAERVTYGELRKRVIALSSALIEEGLAPGERVALLGESRPEWVIAFLAVLRSGAVAVPLDPRWTPPEIARVLTDASPRLVFAGPRSLDDAKRAAQACGLERLVALDSSVPSGIPALEGLQPRATRAAPLRSEREAALLATTSGTTGRPRGAMLSLQTLVFETRSLGRALGLSRDDVFLSMLPVHHLFELVAGHLSALAAGARIVYCDSFLPEEVAAAARREGATRGLSVPLFLKLFRRAIESEVRRAAPPQAQSLAAALDRARRTRSTARRRALLQGLWTRLDIPSLSFFSGGAPLDRDTEEFFELIGWPVFSGYGLSETGPVISTNTPDARKPGSVGRALPGVEVRIAEARRPGDVGEILTRGPHVMLGYDGELERARDLLGDGGWFATGDLGWLDREGFLHVSGRLKTTLVLESGKKVQPEEVEAALANSPALEEVCVFGRPAGPGLAGACERVEVAVVPVRELRESCAGDEERLRAEVLEAIERSATDLASYKRPARVHLLGGALPRSSTGKVQRAILIRRIEEKEERS